jgi:N-acyl-D-aspartate/D-glutamate deacylase
VRRAARLLIVTALASSAAASLLAQRGGRGSGAVHDLVIAGGRVIDPASGLDAVRNVGITSGRIAELSAASLSGKTAIKADGLVVAPGFIDVHAHGQTAETYRFQSLDGVTTSLELELGTANVAQWYDDRKAGQRINYGVSIGHIKVRMAAIADAGTIMPVGPAAYKAASVAEVDDIVRRIAQGLDEGAVSIGAGFPYTPGATYEELLAVFRVAARTSTPVHVHIRPGVAGLEEALALARDTGASLHVVHINSAGYEETPAMLRLIRAARQRGQDVTTEAYPYGAGMTQIESATVQDPYTHERADRVGEIEWPLTGERLNADSFKRYSQIGGPVVIHRNTEEMVTLALADPLTMIGSDAYWLNGTGHPRTTGTYSRVLGRYVWEKRALTLMEAIRKMTLMPAQRLESRVPAMKRKGRIAVGADADLTVFDPARVLDRSTYREPWLPPAGIDYVLVNGTAVVARGRAVDGVTPGIAIRASGPR